MEGIWRVSGGYLEGIWRVYGRYTEGIWRVRTRNAGDGFHGLQCNHSVECPPAFCSHISEVFRSLSSRIKKCGSDGLSEPGDAGAVIKSRLCVFCLNDLNDIFVGRLDLLPGCLDAQSRNQKQICFALRARNSAQI